MNLTRNRIQSIGWAFVLTLCLAMTAALMLRVNAVKGQVRETENRIVSLQRSIQFLEVEFQTRANQQQLSALNSVEFGYVAPGAGQYIDGERQLAAYGVARAPDAPAPIRMAQSVSKTDAMPIVAMVSPLGGTVKQGGPDRAAKKSIDVRTNPDMARDKVEAGDDLIGSAITDARIGTRLARIDISGGSTD